VGYHYFNRLIATEDDIILLDDRLPDKASSVTSLTILSLLTFAAVLAGYDPGHDSGSFYPTRTPRISIGSTPDGSSLPISSYSTEIL
jgi:hypothetical protein